MPAPPATAPPIDPAVQRRIQELEAKVAQYRAREKALLAATHELQCTLMQFEQQVAQDSARKVPRMGVALQAALSTERDPIADREASLG